MDGEACASSGGDARKRAEPRKKANILFVTAVDVEQLEDIKVAKRESDLKRTDTSEGNENRNVYRKSVTVSDGTQSSYNYPSEYTPFKKRRGRKRKRKFAKEHPCCDDSEDDDMGLEAEIDDDEYIRRLEEARQREIEEEEIAALQQKQQTELEKGWPNDEDDMDNDYDVDFFHKPTRKQELDKTDPFDSDYDDADARDGCLSDLNTHNQEWWQHTLEQEIADVMDDSEKPELPLPLSSKDLRCPNQYLLPTIAVYEVLRRYGRLLRLSPFRLEDFIVALTAYENSTVLSEIHISLLKILVKEDDANNTLLCHTDQRDGINLSFYLTDKETWPELLHWYLACTQNEHTLAIQLDSCYPFVHMEKRLAVLQCLIDMFLTSSALRGEIVKEGLTRHEDFCRICHSSGEVLCCDECTGVYHLACLDPPLSEAPETKWSCPVCEKEVVIGVSDCRSEQEKAGMQHQHDMLGKDRFGRKYWFIARRLIVEGRDVEPEAILWQENRQLSSSSSQVAYYSTWVKACQLFNRLSSKWEPDLLEHINLMKDEMQRQMNLTVHLTVARWNAYKDANHPNPPSKVPLILHEMVDAVKTESDTSQGISNVNHALKDVERSNELSLFSEAVTETNGSSNVYFTSPSIPSNVFTLLREIEMVISASPIRFLDGYQRWLKESVVNPQGLHGSIRGACVNSVHEVPQPLRPDSPTGVFEEFSQRQGFPAASKELVLTARNRDGTRLRLRFSNNMRLSLTKHIQGDDPKSNALQLSDWRDNDRIQNADDLHSYFSYFCLGDEGTWRNWRNLYSSDPTALSKQQYQEERERRKGWQNKFSLPPLVSSPMEAPQNNSSMSPSDWHWVCGGPLQAISEGRPFHILNVMKLTLAFIETQIPSALYCSAWFHIRPKWHSSVYKARACAELAKALATLEACIKPVCFHRAWYNSLGHLELDRTMAEEREEQKRLVMLERKLRQGTEITDNSIIRTRNPRLIRHTIWKTRGEEYRRLGGDGWMWLNASYGNPKQRTYNNRIRSRPLQKDFCVFSVSVPTPVNVADNELNPLTGKPYVYEPGYQVINEEFDMSSALRDPNRANGIYARWNRSECDAFLPKAGFLDTLLGHRENMDADLRQNGFTIAKGEERLLELQQYKQRLLEKREKITQLLEGLENRPDLPTSEELNSLFTTTRIEDKECEMLLRGDAASWKVDESELSKTNDIFLVDDLENNEPVSAVDQDLEILLNDANSLPIDLILPQMDGINEANFAVRSRPHQMNNSFVQVVPPRNVGIPLRKGVPPNSFHPILPATLPFRQQSGISSLGLGQPMMMKMSTQSQAQQNQSVAPNIQRPQSQVQVNPPRLYHDPLSSSTARVSIPNPVGSSIRFVRLVNPAGATSVPQRYAVFSHPMVQAPSRNVTRPSMTPLTSSQQLSYPLTNAIQSVHKSVYIQKYSANDSIETLDSTPVIQSVCSLAHSNVQSGFTINPPNRPSLSTRIGGGSAGRKCIPGISSQQTPIQGPATALAIRTQQSQARRQRLQEITAAIQKHLTAVENQIEKVTECMSHLEKRLVFAEKTSADTFTLIVPGKACSSPKDRINQRKVSAYPQPVNFNIWGRNNQNMLSLFRLSSSSFRQCILAAGRMELPGWDIEKKRSAQVLWPYPSARPGFCVAWRYRLAYSSDSIASLALHMRILWHSLRWDDITEKISNSDGFCPLPPGGGIRSSEMVDEPGGLHEGGGSGGNSGPPRRRLIVDMRKKDKYGLVCEYLVQLHSQGVSPSSTSSVAHSTRHSGRQLSNSIISSLMGKDSENEDLHEVSNPATLLGVTDENAYASDDPDFDPRSCNSRPRRTGVTSSGRRSTAVAAKQSASNNSNSHMSNKWHVIKEEWVADFDLQLWEIRAFVEKSLSVESNRKSASQTSALSSIPNVPPRQENQLKVSLPRVPLSIPRPLTAPQISQPNIVPTSLPSLTSSKESLNSRPSVSQRPPPRTPVLSTPTPMNSEAIRAKFLSQQRHRLTVNMERLAKQLEQTMIEKKKCLSLRSLIEVDAELTLRLKKESDAREADRKRQAENAMLKRVHAKRAAMKRKQLLEEKKRGKKRRRSESKTKVIANESSNYNGDDTDPCMDELEKVVNRKKSRSQRHLSPENVEETAHSSRIPTIPASEATKRVQRLQSPDSERKERAQEDILLQAPRRGRPPKKTLDSTPTPSIRAAPVETTPSSPPPVPKKRGRPSRKHFEEVTAENIESSLADQPEPLYCVCQTPYNYKVGYIGCDSCDGWYHFTCVGVSITDAKILEHWECPKCVASKIKGKTSKIKKEATEENEPPKEAPAKSGRSKSTKATKEESHIEVKQEQEALYCFCRTPYDATKAYIACDGCDEWYHAQCVGLKEEEALNIAGTYICPRCKPTEDVVSPGSSKPPPFSLLSLRDTDIFVSEAVRRKLKKILSDLINSPSAKYFLGPVDAKTYPTYRTVVSSPIDFSTIGQNLRHGRYSTVGEFVEDVCRIFDNCRAYFSSDSTESRSADSLETQFSQLMQDLSS